MINKDNIIFKIIIRDNKRSSHIREKNFKCWDERIDEVVKYNLWLLLQLQA